MNNFFGEFRHNIDSKGRLILPSRFREILGERFVISCGLDSCLEISSIEKWEERLSSLSQLSQNRKENRQFIRMISHGMQEIETDRMGRFTVPQTLREYAGITKEVVITGVLDRIEVWSRKNWEEYYKEARDNFEANAEKIDIE